MKKDKVIDFLKKLEDHYDKMWDIHSEKNNEKWMDYTEFMSVASHNARVEYANSQEEDVFAILEARKVHFEKLIVQDHVLHLDNRVEWHTGLLNATVVLEKRLRNKFKMEEKAS